MIGLICQVMAFSTFGKELLSPHVEAN